MLGKKRIGGMRKAVMPATGMATRNPNRGVKPGMMKKAVIGKKLGAMKRRAI